MSKLKDAPHHFYPYSLEELNDDPLPDPKDVLNYDPNGSGAITLDIFNMFDVVDTSEILEVEESNLIKTMYGILFYHLPLFPDMDPYRQTRDLVRVLIQ